MGENARGVTRRQALHVFGAGGAALALPALLAACGGGSGGGSTAGTSTGSGNVGGASTDAEIASVTWGLRSALLTLDMATGASADGVLVMGLGFEGLVGYDADLRMVPLLAETYDAPNPRTYEFRLRRGTRFWDGRPVTADDVVWSISRHLDADGGSQISYSFSSVASVETRGADGVVIRLRAPDPTLLDKLTFTYIHPRALGEQLGRRLGAPGDTITTMGTGPYRFTSFSADDGVTVERNEDYWGEKPTVLRAELRYLLTPQTQMLALRSGEIDGLFDFPVAQGGEWDKLGGVVTEYAPGMRSIFLCIDVTKAPFDDVHVRRAVAHAADREGYVRAFLGGHGTAGPTIVPRAQWTEFVPDDEADAIYEGLPHYEYDLDKAKEELAKSRHPDGFSTEIVFPNHEPAVGRALVSLAESLSQIGIRLEVREVTRTAWGAEIDAHANPGMFYLGFSPDYPDPANFPMLCFPSDEAVRGGYNLANFRSPEVDRLLREQNDTTDDSERARLIARVLEITSEELPYLPLWWQESSLALRDDYVFEGFTSLYYASNSFLSSIRARA